MTNILDRTVPVTWDMVLRGTEFADYARVHGRLEAGSTSFQDVNDFGDFTFIDRVTAAVGLKCSSSNAGDTMDILVTGLDANDVLQTVQQTLAGQTKTDVGTAKTWNRVYRAEVVGSATPAGDVYVYQDDTVAAGVPANLSTKGQLKITNGFNQSLSGSFTIPTKKRGLIIDIRGGLASSVGIRSRIGVRTGIVAFVSRFVGDGLSINAPNMAVPVFLPADADVRVQARQTSGSTPITYELLIALLAE